MTVNDNKDIVFEDALDRLEEIISKLQSPNMTLDESLKAFEEGVGLIRLCQEKLDKAESKVSMLIKDSSGAINQVPFKFEVEE